MTDKVIVYESHEGDWRWKRVNEGNNETLSASTEGYERKRYAQEQAEKLNPGITIEVWE